MLYELVVTPQVFDKTNLEESPNQWYRETLEILKAASRQGIIISLNKDAWIKESLTKLNYLSPHLKDKILEIFKRLKDRNLIVKIPKTQITPNNEEEWLMVVNESQRGAPFGLVVASTHKEDKVLTPIEVIDSQIWEEYNCPVIYIEQTAENMKKHLANFLRYGQKLQIIDPYFNVEKHRYKKSLNIIAEQFSSRRGLRQKSTINIHCKYENLVTTTPKYENQWKQIKDEIFKKYGHICKVHIWKEDEKKMHDRFIITDQFGIAIGAGLDVRAQNKTSWSLIDTNTKSEVLKDYQENSSPFELVKIIR